MSIVQTLLVFVGIPAGIVLLAAAVVLGPGAIRAPRYRPGYPWEFEPVWYLPHPGAVNTDAVGSPAKASGGASGEW